MNAGYVVVLSVSYISHVDAEAIAPCGHGLECLRLVPEAWQKPKRTIAKAKVFSYSLLVNWVFDNGFFNRFLYAFDLLV